MSKFDKEDGFSCDYCGETIGGGDSDFHESVEEKKSSGWISRTVDGEWYDFCCDECYKQFLDERKENE